MPYASQGVKGFDDNKNCAVLSCGQQYMEALHGCPMLHRE